VVSEYLAAGRAAGGDTPFAPSYGSIEGYVAAKVMAEGLRRTGSALSTDSLITALESMRDFNVGGFFVDFGPNKHTGSRFVDLTILTRDGRVRR
jgi:ABC-type branched-subunit amino acid transport system substrate-binding protein